MHATLQWYFSGNRLHAVLVPHREKSLSLSLPLIESGSFARLLCSIAAYQLRDGAVNSDSGTDADQILFYFIHNRI